MHLEHLTLDGVTVVRVDPVLTYEAGAALLDAVKLGDRASTRWVLDMRRVSYIDSAGLGALLAVYRHLSSRGGGLRLVRLGPRGQRLLAMTALGDILLSFETEDEARASFAEPAAAGE
jgi:anti-anti-sigma factor